MCEPRKYLSENTKIGIASIVLGVVIVLFIRLLVYGNDYRKDLDGTLIQAVPVSTSVLSDRLVQIDVGLKDIQYQKVRYQDLLVFYTDAISSCDAKIADLETEKTNIQELLK